MEIYNISRRYPAEEHQNKWNDKEIEERKANSKRINNSPTYKTQY